MLRGRACAASAPTPPAPTVLNEPTRTTEAPPAQPRAPRNPGDDGRMPCSAVCGGRARRVLAGVGWVVAVADSGPNLTSSSRRSPHPPTQIFAADGSSLGYVALRHVHNHVAGNADPAAAQARRRSRSRTGASTSTARSTTRASCAPAIKDLFNGGDCAAGRLDADHAAGRQHVPAGTSIASQPRPEVQDHPGQARRAARGQALQELDPRQLPQRRARTGPSAARPPIGVGAASQMFFDKPVRKLNLAQMALLAGPAAGAVRVQPVPGPAAGAQRRRDEVLQAMVAAALHHARRRPTAAEPPAARGQARHALQSTKRSPYVFDYVEQQLPTTCAPSAEHCRRSTAG